MPNNHHIKLFVVNGAIQYIHHRPSNPNNDGPGVHVNAPHGDKFRWVAPVDGGFSVEFKSESPFVSGAGAPGNPIVSADGSMTPLETMKQIATVRRKFPYTVKLAAITDDPELIIDDSGGGGPKQVKAKKKK